MEDRRIPRLAEPARRAVLVVDDEMLCRVHLVDALLEHGYDVVEAASGDDALLALAARRVDLVVTDIRMPGLLNGIMLSEMIAQEYPGMPVLMMSGEWPAPEDTAAIVEFFPKPVDVAALRRLIGELLAQDSAAGQVAEERAPGPL